MTNMRYPVLLVGDAIVMSVNSPADLERTLGYTTRTAERALYWDSVVLVDQDLKRYAIRGLKLGRSPGFFTWMKRVRPVLSWEACPCGSVDLRWIKECAIKVLSANDVVDADMRDDLVRAIQAAPTISAVAAALP